MIIAGINLPLVELTLLMQISAIILLAKILKNRSHSSLKDVKTEFKHIIEDHHIVRMPKTTKKGKHTRRQKA